MHPPPDPDKVSPCLLMSQVLQLYAALQLRGKETEGVAGIINDVVYAEEQHWGTIIK